MKKKVEINNKKTRIKILKKKSMNKEQITNK